jgi:hypothetical protein
VFLPQKWGVGGGRRPVVAGHQMMFAFGKMMNQKLKYFSLQKNAKELTRLHKNDIIKYSKKQ